VLLKSPVQNKVAVWIHREKNYSFLPVSGLTLTWELILLLLVEGSQNVDLIEDEEDDHSTQGLVCMCEGGLLPPRNRYSRSHDHRALEMSLKGGRY
jgi:hypothetical protein